MAEESFRLALRDGASMFALHPRELLHVAVPIYPRMGFKRVSGAPAIHGVEYDVYVKKLDANSRSSPETRENPRKPGELEPCPSP